MTYGVAPDDAFSLYVAYYVGWASFGRGDWRGNSSLISYAHKTEQTAHDYAAQLQRCG